MRFGESIRGALDVVFGGACAACGVPGPPCCGRCHGGMRRIPGPTCARCGHPTPLAVERCPSCVGAVVARHAVSYDGPVPALVTAFKDRDVRRLGAVFAAEMANTIERPAADAVLVPVPLSPRRRRLGGANHARLLAIHLAREWGLPVVEALARRVDGPSQRGRGRTARLRQVVGAFTSVGPTIGGPVVLVDDVHTTGATIGACARVLRRAGAADVGAVTFARVWSER